MLEDAAAQADAEARLRSAVRDRESRCVQHLLDLHGFGPDDIRLADLNISQGEWDDDIFDPDTLARYGVSAGTAAATGAGVGVAIDVMAGGSTLGGAAAAGAALGFLYDTARKHGGRVAARMRGEGRLRVDDATLTLLAVREVHLVRALLQRGHGAVAPAAVADAGLEAEGGPVSGALGRIARQARRARGEPGWSRLARGSDRTPGGRRRADLIAALASDLEQAFGES